MSYILYTFIHFDLVLGRVMLTATLCATVGIVVSAAHERVENAASQNWNLINRTTHREAQV